MEVFVLICESVYETSEETISCAVFDTLEKAYEQMRKEWKESSKDWEGEIYVHDIGPTWAYHEQEFRFNERHCQWTIEKEEVH